MKRSAGLVFGAAILAGCTAGAVSDLPEGSKRVEVCEPIDEEGVARLFDRWNESLAAGDPEGVVDNYAESSVLLPTISSTKRIDRQGKQDYFTHFLAAEPSGAVIARKIDIGCNMVSDSGLYDFFMGSTGETVRARYTYVYRWENGQWLISSHHSSLVPK